MQFMLNEFTKQFEQEVNNSDYYKHDISFYINHFIVRTGVFLNRSNILWKFTWGKMQNDTYVVKYPLGRMRKFGQTEHGSHKTLEREYYYHIFIWRFMLAKQIRLNITFYYIYIKFNTLDVCYTGNVTIKSISVSQKALSVYCGIHSSLLNYPPYQITNITVALRPYVSYDIKFLYGMINSNEIISYPVFEDVYMRPQ